MLNTHARPRPVALLAGVLASVLLVFGLGTPQAQASTVLTNQYGQLKSHIVGSFGKHGTVTGTFEPTRFRTSSSGKKLFAVGTLTATLTRGSGHVVGTDTSQVRIPVKRIAGDPVSGAARAAALAPSCDILNLVLGPLDLDLLGLQVHLDKVVLNIVAQSGAGNLLGNLLCAVAGLLDNTGALSQITDILNSILAILRL
jgi:hypothetical protein